MSLISDISSRLKKLSPEALTVWRQIVNRPIKVSFSVAQSAPVQELVEAALAYLRPEESVREYGIHLSKACQPLRLNSEQRNLVIKLSAGPMHMKKYLAWAREEGIEHRLEFLKPLTELLVIEATNTTDGIVLKLL